MYRAGQGPVQGQGIVLAIGQALKQRRLPHVKAPLLIYALILHMFPFVNLRIDIAKDKYMPCPVLGKAFLGPGPI